MSESAPDTGTTDQPDTGTSTTPDTGNPPPDTGTADVEALRADVEKWRKLAKKHEDRAASNADAAKELDRIRREEMPAAERAVTEAVEAAKAQIATELRTQYGGRLVAAEIRAAAKGRLGDTQLDAILSRLNVASFLDAEGEVDATEVKRFVDGLMPAEPEAPEPRGGFPDLGQGARQGTPLNGDPILRDIKAKLGIT